MKVQHFLLAILCFLSVQATAQITKAFNYQALIRDGLGNPSRGRSYPIRVDIIQGTRSVYAEKHLRSTDTFGLMNLPIGLGEVLSIGTPSVLSDFSKIQWNFVPTVLRISDAITGTAIAQTAILAVPIALYADKVWWQIRLRSL